MNYVHSGKFREISAKITFRPAILPFIKGVKKYFWMNYRQRKSIPAYISGEKAALFINHYLKLAGTLCCIVPNITLSLTCH
jgi:hypothetical protein